MSRRQKQAVEKSQDHVVKNFTYAAATLAALAILCSLWALTREWDKPLLDLHSFRQTQTAISTYYMVGNPGILLNYETPILGKPWAIPLEVPFYQWVVARWHEVSSMGLDQSGKFVSIIFLFACIGPIWILFRTLRIPLAPRWLTIAVFLSMPLHLYWGRAFLIETMGLFLSISMVSCTFSGYRSKNWRWLATGLVFGILAALCKITTWAVACGVVGLLVLFSEGLPRRKDLAWLILTAAMAILPIVPGKLWLAHGDDVKAANPFAREIITASSDKQSAWTFGSWEQKTTPAVWERIGSHIGDQLAAPLPFFGHWLVPLILIAGALASPKRLPLLSIFLVGFAAGPLVFTNLYFEHNYYWVANGTWLILSLGVALAAISEFRPKEVWPQYTATALSAVLCISGFAAWHSKFLPVLQNLPDREKLTEAWIGPIQKLVPPDRSLLILGNDWNPVALYYAARKGLAFPLGPSIPFPGPQLDQALQELRGELAGVVITPQMLQAADHGFWVDFLSRQGVSTNGSPTAFGLLFLHK